MYIVFTMFSYREVTIAGKGPLPGAYDLLVGGDYYCVVHVPAMTRHFGLDSLIQKIASFSCLLRQA